MDAPVYFHFACFSEKKNSYVITFREKLNKNKLRLTLSFNFVTNKF